jgi:hypothetical protein
MTPMPAPAPRRPAVVVGGWTIAYRAGRVYLTSDGDVAALHPGLALELAAELHQAALDADRAEAAALADAEGLAAAPRRAAEDARRSPEPPRAHHPKGAPPCP